MIAAAGQPPPFRRRSAASRQHPIDFCFPLNGQRLKSIANFPSFTQPPVSLPECRVSMPRFQRPTSPRHCSPPWGEAKANRPKQAEVKEEPGVKLPANQRVANICRSVRQWTTGPRASIIRRSTIFRYRFAQTLSSGSTPKPGELGGVAKALHVTGALPGTGSTLKCACDNQLANRLASGVDAAR